MEEDNSINVVFVLLRNKANSDKETNSCALNCGRPTKPSLPLHTIHCILYNTWKVSQWIFSWSPLYHCNRSLVLLEVIDFDNPLIFLLLTCFYLCHFYFITIPSLYQKKDLLFQIENVALIIPPHPTLPSSVIGSYVSFCLQSLILIGFSWHTYDAIVPNLQTYDDSLQADKLGHNIHCFLKLFRAAKTMDAYPFTHPIHLYKVLHPSEKASFVFGK